MTPLNPAQIMQYATSFQERLEIQVEKAEDFDVAIVALKALSKNVSAPQQLDSYPLLANRISSLQETYVELGTFLKPEDLKTIQDLFEVKVQEKIQELEQLTPEQREGCAQKQKIKREETAQKQELLRSKKRLKPTVLTAEQSQQEIERKSAATSQFIRFTSVLTEDRPNDGSIIRNLTRCCNYLPYYLLDELDCLLPTALRYHCSDLVSKIVEQRMYFDLSEKGMRALLLHLVQFPSALFKDADLLPLLATKDPKIALFLKVRAESESIYDFIHRSSSEPLLQQIPDLLSAYVEFFGNFED